MNMQMMDDNPHFINEISCEDNFDPHCNPFSETNGIRKFTSNTIKEVSEALKIDLNKLRDCVRGDQVSYSLMQPKNLCIIVSQNLCHPLVGGTGFLACISPGKLCFFLRTEFLWRKLPTNDLMTQKKYH